MDINKQLARLKRLADKKKSVDDLTLFRDRGADAYTLQKSKMNTIENNDSIIVTDNNQVSMNVSLISRSQNLNESYTELAIKNIVLAEKEKPSEKQSEGNKKIGRNLISDLGLTINMNPKRFMTRKMDDSDTDYIFRRKSSINDDYSGTAAPIFKKRRSDKEKKLSVFSLMTNN